MHLSSAEFIVAPGFVIFSVTLLLAALLLALTNGTEVTSHSFYAVREHHIA